MPTGQILVAGIGNIFLGDDGFGVEVAQRLLQQKLPNHVWVVDFGIRSLDLAYAIQDGYQTTSRRAWSFCKPSWAAPAF